MHPVDRSAIRPRVLLVGTDGGLTTDPHSLAAFREDGWDVRVLFESDRGPLPTEARVPDVHGDGPVARADAVRHAVEALHNKQPFDLILFTARGGIGFRAIQAKRAGLALTDATLAVVLDGNSQRDREANQRWPAKFAHVETDYLERFAFENADLQITPDDTLTAFVRANHWTVRPDATPSYPRPGFRGEGGRASRPGEGFEATPLVTVAIAYYNLGPFLPDTLATLAAQTYPHVEVIVIDDGSTDPHSRTVFNAMAQKYPHWQFHTQANAGIGATRNRILARARGEFFIPVDADNLTKPEMVATFVTAMQRNPALAAMSCDFLAFDVAAPTLVPDRFLYAHRPTGGPHALAGIRNVYGDANAVFRTAALRAVGGYEEDRGTSCEDWEVFVKLVHAGHRLGVVPAVLFYYRHRPGGFSRSTNWFRNHQRVLRQFATPGTLSPADTLALWTALLGFHQELENQANAAVPRRHRLADRLVSGVQRLWRWVRRLREGA